MPRINNRYTESDKATALAIYATNQNVRQTARDLNIPFETLKGWIKCVSKMDSVTDAINEKTLDKKADLAKQFEDMANEALKRANIEIDNATYAQLMTGAAIAVDKMRLLRELPTSNENVKQTIRVVYDDSPPTPS